VLIGRFHSGYFTIIRSFIQSIRNNTNATVSMEQAREVVIVLEGITRLAKTDVKVSVIIRGCIRRLVSCHRMSLRNY
jgi:hypothetical protein